MDSMFAFHNLPDDIVHCVLEEWVHDLEAGFFKLLGNLKELIALDIAYCNRSLRPIMQRSMEGTHVHVEESYLRDSRKKLFKWIQDRKLKMQSLSLDQTSKHSQRLTRRERMPPFELLRDVQAISVKVDLLSDLDHRTISAVLEETKLASTTLKLGLSAVSQLSQRTLELLSRLTKLETQVPQVLNVMESLPPTLRELSCDFTVPAANRSVWQSTAFAALEKLSISGLFHSEENFFDERVRHREWMDDVDERAAEGILPAQLPQLTHLSISFDSMELVDSMYRLYAFFTRGAPLLTRLEITDMLDWARGLSVALVTQPPPQLRSLTLRKGEFCLKANSKVPFRPLRADEFSAVSRHFTRVIEELCLNVLHFVTQEPTVVVELTVIHFSREVLNLLPWETLSMGMLHSLHIGSDNIRNIPQSTWVDMLMAPSSRLWVEYFVMQERKERVGLLDALSAIEKSERKSTVTALDWRIEGAQDSSLVARLEEVTLSAILSGFPNVVHFDCEIPSVDDANYASFLDGWPRLRQLVIRRSNKVSLSSELIATPIWQRLLSTTLCHTFCFGKCSSMTLENILFFAYELRERNTMLRDWLLEWADDKESLTYFVMPRYNDATGKTLTISYRRSGERFHDEG